MLRVSTIVGCVSALLLVSACTSSSSPTPTPTATPPATTDTFTGTLAQNSSVLNTFTVNATGTVTFILVSLQPQSTITMGLGVGTPNGGSCGVSTTQENFKVGTAFTTTLSAGTYCVVLYDLGNMIGPNTYTLTVLHP